MNNQAEIIDRIRSILQNDYVALLGQRDTELGNVIRSLVSQTDQVSGMQFISIALPWGVDNSDDFTQLFLNRLEEALKSVPPIPSLGQEIRNTIAENENFSVSVRLRLALDALGRKSMATPLVIVLQSIARTPVEPLKGLLLMLREYHTQRNDPTQPGAKLRFLVTGEAILWRLCYDKTVTTSPFNIAKRVFLNGLTNREIQKIYTYGDLERATRLREFTDGIPGLIERVIKHNANSDMLQVLFEPLLDHWLHLPLESRKLLERLATEEMHFPTCVLDYTCPQIPELRLPWSEAFWSGFLKVTDRALIWRSPIHQAFVMTRIEQQHGVELSRSAQLAKLLSDIDSLQNEPGNNNASGNYPGRRDSPRGKNTPTTTILLLAANPMDTIRLKLDEEARAIDQALRQSQYRNRFEVRQHWAVQVKDVQSYLLRHKPDIVHFSGHGTESRQIILQNDISNSHPVSTRALSGLFSVFKDDIRCVVLNACYSEKQAQTIAEHIDYVVGMPNAIKDSTAISFATAFYQALGYGNDIETAFELGCVQIGLENLDEQDIPKLLTRKKIDSGPDW